ncbi:MAG: DUF3135 domain-containing protein [Candidatus Polarisedimenticolaceae bacterium]|nr:DUF3135 domain-containing protein [Candidatus Polarisedimenticolaceae bacterium]
MEFDFDKLADLAQQDPAAFEAERKKILAAMINKTHPEIQHSLESLQTEIDNRRNQSNEPMGFFLWLSHLLEDQIVKDFFLSRNCANSSQNPTKSEKGKEAPAIDNQTKE